MKTSFSISVGFIVALAIAAVFVAVAYRIYLGDLDSNSLAAVIICGLAFFFHADTPAEFLSKLITED